MTENLTAELETYIAKEILRQPNRKIAADAAIISSGMIDSFHLVDLALFVEEKYGVRIDDSELNADTFDSLDQLASIIRQRQS